jgi:DNA (cytosine-5)-methyltransferase 1
MTLAPLRPEERRDSQSTSVRRPIAIDLFAGAGGLSLGLEQAGFDVVASVEYDPIHCAVHSYNFPLTEVICGDITATTRRELRLAIRSGMQMHGHDLRTWDQDIDLVAGGPPCQGFSTIGQHLIDDKRNRLVFEFFRVVSELKPRYFLMENVPGMMGGGHKTGILDRLIEEFTEAGYDVVEPPRVLLAALYGVPQDRRRLVLLGARRGLPLPAYPDPIVQPRLKHAGARPLTRMLLEDLPIGPSVWDAIGDLPDADDFPTLLASDEVALSPQLVADMATHGTAYSRMLRGESDEPDDFSHPRTWDASILTSSMRTVHTALSVRRFIETVPGTVEPVSRFYRLTSDGLCNTIRAGTGSEHGAFTSPRPLHPRLPRVLTVREAARLHSFPDWFRLHQTKWHGFRQVGNAVPPLLGRAVGREIARALGIEPKAPAVSIPLGDPTLLAMDMSTAREYFGADASGMPEQRRRPGAGIARREGAIS